MTRFFAYIFSSLVIIIGAPIKGHSSGEIKEYYISVTPLINLRVVKVTSAQPSHPSVPKNVVILLPGRASFFEKGKDFVDILTGHSPSLSQQQPAIPNLFRALNTDVWVIDYRAHGKSDGRLGKDDQRCHINDFQDYLADIHTVITRHILPSYASTVANFYLMGSSLGGHLALRYVEEYEHQFNKVILIAPMLDFKTQPWPKWLAKLIVKGACQLGLREKYAVGYGDMNFAKQTFNREKSHHNRQAFEETLALLKENPNLITSGPTNAWVSAAFDSKTIVLDPERLKKVLIPVVIYAAGEDVQVENLAMQTAHKFLPKSKLITIQGAWHNLLKESDAYRLEFLRSLAKELSVSPMRAARLEGVN